MPVFIYVVVSWWCPALPYPGGCSTIGAGGLSFRVRYGAGRGSPAMTTRTGLVGAPAGYCGPPGCGGWCPGGVRAPCSVLVSRVRGCAPVWCGPACVVGVGRGPYSGRPPPPGGWSVARSVCLACVCCVGLLVPVSSTGHPASTPGLSTRSSTGGLPHHPWGGVWRPGLGDGFPLRCLQRLPLPDVANQPCPWRDNWHTRGPSVPVLSY